MWSWFTNGNLETNDGDSIAEGIGQGRVTKNIEGVKVDRAYRIPDQIGLTIVYQLLREEGLFLGLSSGINVAGAVRFAKESGPGQTIVTILCDSGQKYQSTLFNRDWLASNHLDPDLPLESILDANLKILNQESRNSSFREMDSSFLIPEFLKNHVSLFGPVFEVSEAGVSRYGRGGGVGRGLGVGWSLGVGVGLGVL